MTPPNFSYTAENIVNSFHYKERPGHITRAMILGVIQSALEFAYLQGLENFKKTPECAELLIEALRKSHEMRMK